MSTNNKSIWLYNGIAFPAPLLGYKIIGQQLVSEGRNANGEVMIQKINRRMMKHDNVVFPVSDYDEVLRFRRHVENMEVWVTYWDILRDGIAERKFYFGDFSCEPIEFKDVGAAVLKPTKFKDVRCNLIDMGLPDR